MAQPKVQALSQILAELEPAYASSRGLYNTQMQQLPQFEQAGMQQLEGAKTNAFRDIARSANTRGLDFWGVPIEEQATYLGEHFLPGQTQLKQNTMQGMNQLQLALAQLEQDKYKTGLGTRQQQQSSLDQFMEAERQRAHQAQLQREQIAADNARAAMQRQQQQSATPTLSKNKQGGWDVSGGYDLAGYSRATGKDLITLLSQGDAQDRKAAQYYKDNIRLGRGEAYAMERLMYYDRPTAFFRGG